MELNANQPGAQNHIRVLLFVVPLALLICGAIASWNLTYVLTVTKTDGAHIRTLCFGYAKCELKTEDPHRYIASKTVTTRPCLDSSGKPTTTKCALCTSSSAGTCDPEVSTQSGTYSTGVEVRVASGMVTVLATRFLPAGIVDAKGLPDAPNLHVPPTINDLAIESCVTTKTLEPGSKMALCDVGVETEPVGGYLEKHWL